jgi:pimeloyl-ACP methyl ester carboxylesterase
MPIEIARHWARLSTVGMNYRTAGDGDPVVLPHGWPQTSHEWRRVIPLLAPRHRAIEG